jgi:glyoxylase-like metal-dependent hydrolase (beta-lactamase superfamily II)
MRFGDIEVLYLDGGSFALDGGAMFGVVPKVLWEKKAPPDEKNRIRLRCNSLLVRAHRKNILIETGNGTKWDAKLRGIYAVQDGDPLMDSLARLGVSPDEIDLVINTHLHFDHCGGNTRVVQNRVLPTFRHARYVVQRGELEHAMDPTEREHASYFPDNFGPISKEGLWDLVEGDVEILPGISVARIPGHNANIQAVTIQGVANPCRLLRICFRHGTISLCPGSWPTICTRFRRSKPSASGFLAWLPRTPSLSSATILTLLPRPFTSATAKSNSSRWTSSGS